MNKVSNPDELREMKEYEEGRESFLHDADETELNPYKHGDRRIAWYTGWYDLRTAERLGITFP